MNFNDTRAEYPRDKTIHQLFAGQAELTPYHTALVGVEGTRGLAPLPTPISITYKELNEQSHRLAYLLREKDALKHFNDSIGCTGHWLKPGIVYEIPYRTLVVRELKNIFATGRIISASGDAWEATRIIPPAVLTGQAAGTAATMAIRKKCSASELPVTDLQENLQESGVLLHYENQS